MSGPEVAIGAQVGGTVMSAFGQMGEGDDAKAYSSYISAQLRRNAIQEVAAAQRQVENERLNTDLVTSRALAVAAAGGGASDPGVMRIIADIEGEGSYRESVALYNGEEAARALTDQAAATDYEGSQIKKASRRKAIGTIFKGGASLYEKFANIGPTAGGYSTKSNPGGHFDASGWSGMGSNPTWGKT